MLKNFVTFLEETIKKAHLWISGLGFQSAMFFIAVEIILYIAFVKFVAFVWKKKYERPLPGEGYLFFVLLPFIILQIVLWII